jgi:electron transport complex protein RnfD
MQRVLLALVPGVLASIWFHGIGVLANLALAATTALLCEAAMLSARSRPLRPHLHDFSALVTAVLLAIALPPFAPWWLPVLGSAFAIVVAKHLYGGLGTNPFNPAMAGYVLLLISFPRDMTLWLAPDAALGAGDWLHHLFTGDWQVERPLDALTSATPLDRIKTGLGLGQTVAEIRTQAPPAHAGTQWIALGFLTGGLWLLWRRIITWHIPAGVLAGIFLAALLPWLGDSDGHASPLFHLGYGASMLGAFFIATDPVTACASPKGRLIFGVGIGLITVLIRNLGGYPDGIAFAVLLMNMAAPLIDHYTRPRAYGEGEERG